VFSSNVLTDVQSGHPDLEGSVIETNLDSAAK